MRLYFAMDQGFPFVVFPISPHYVCCSVMPNNLESEGEKNWLISLKFQMLVPANL